MGSSLTGSWPTSPPATEIRASEDASRSLTEKPSTKPTNGPQRQDFRPYRRVAAGWSDGLVDTTKIEF